MKKFGFLPTAKKIPLDALFDNEPSEKKKSSKSDIILGFIAIIFISSGVADIFFNIKGLSFFSELVGLSIGVWLLFSKSAAPSINGRAVKNTFWVRIPFAFGLIFMGAAIYTEHFKNGDPEGFGNVKRILSTAVIFAVFGLGVYFFILSLAVTKRAEECTECVYAEPYENVCASARKDGDLVYSYYYEGENYRFSIPEDVTVVLDEDSDFVICIDPGKPERYYSEMLFRRSSKEMRTFFTVEAALLIFAFVLW